MIGKYVYDHLAPTGYSLGEPEGTFYVFPTIEPHRERLKDHNISSTRDLVYTLLREYQVAVLGVSAFGLPKEELSFRMAYINNNS